MLEHTSKQLSQTLENFAKTVRLYNLCIQYSVELRCGASDFLETKLSYVKIAKESTLTFITHSAMVTFRIKDAKTVSFHMWFLQVNELDPVWCNSSCIMVVS